MNHLSVLIAVEGPGGLFDINATLPLVIIQFFLLVKSVVIVSNKLSIYF